MEPPSSRVLSFSCQPKILSAIFEQHLIHEPGSAYVYSDLSMITMMFIIGNIARNHNLVERKDLLVDCTRADDHENIGDAVAPIDQCFYEAYVREAVFSKVDDPSDINFRPQPDDWKRCAPTWNDTLSGFPGECVRPFRERVLKGQVSDGNAFAMGGIAGHAGLFATAPQLRSLVSQILFGGSASPLGLSAETVKLFTTIHNASQSSRALGWDTNDYRANSYRGCGNLSAATVTHTGYTGTQICADPLTRGGLITILLTNRVYPRADETSLHKIHAARQAFNNAVLAAVNFI